jgi:hypothetical protein
MILKQLHSVNPSVMMWLKLKYCPGHRSFKFKLAEILLAHYDAQRMVMQGIECHFLFHIMQYFAVAYFPKTTD